MKGPAPRNTLSPEVRGPSTPSSPVEEFKGRHARSEEPQPRHLPSNPIPATRANLLSRQEPSEPSGLSSAGSGLRKPGPEVQSLPELNMASIVQASASRPEKRWPPQATRGGGAWGTG